MTYSKKRSRPSEALKETVDRESAQFEKALRWLELHMPPNFLEETDLETHRLIARNLMSFEMQDRFSQIHLKHMAIVLCLDGADGDLKVLKKYGRHKIFCYRTFVSNEPPLGEGDRLLRVALLYFRESSQEHLHLLDEQKRQLYSLVLERNSDITPHIFEQLLTVIPRRFAHSMSNERLAIAIDLFARAQQSDECQFAIRTLDDWKQTHSPSAQILFAWKNVPTAGFLYRLAQVIYSHGLTMQKALTAYTDPFAPDAILLLCVGLHGQNNNAANEQTNLDDLLQELSLLKYFNTDDIIHETFVKPNLLSGNQAHIVRNLGSFVHQALVYADPNLYSFDHVQEGLCRHPELTVLLCKAFEAKFNPSAPNISAFKQIAEEFSSLVDKLDTGQAVYDLRRKNILRQALYCIDYTLKTNFYQTNKSAFSFRLDPAYLDQLPFDRRDKFPALPYAIFFIRGMHFIGFNIRFKDLARGGVRTVIPEKWENYFHERGNIFSEAYNLAYTQHKKNKDIPEGGAKTAILLAPFDVFSQEEQIFIQDLQLDGLSEEMIAEKQKIYRREHKKAYLFASQRSFIQAFMALIDCHSDGTLKDKHIVDYYKRPEYIYLGPDENMLNDMIVWIADYAERLHYRPGRSFMSSKPGAGINHKEYGVTSFGVHVYLQQTLHYLGIDPNKTSFTVKISGGPDGDVAGNEIHLLATQYPNTAKLVALTDVSGTIRDAKGLDWKEMLKLFKEGLPIRAYPPEKLHDGGILLDLQTKKEQSAYAQQTLCWSKINGKLTQTWLSGNEMNHLFRSNVHETPADIFMPCGGRPRTLNEANYQTFLDKTSQPTARAIIEGANLYLTPAARRALEKLGVLVLKDSSCNKGGVTCSSFEVLASLCLTEEEFLKEKNAYVKQVLEIIRTQCLNEANLLLETYAQSQIFLTDLSDQISERINLYKYQILDYLEPCSLSSDRNDPLIQSLFAYCPPLLVERYADRILNMPDIHKKAVIAAHLASELVYKRGLQWAPTIVDILSQVVNKQ